MKRRTFFGWLAAAGGSLLGLGRARSAETPFFTPINPRTHPSGTNIGGVVVHWNDLTAVKEFWVQGSGHPVDLGPGVVTFGRIDS